MKLSEKIQEALRKQQESNLSDPAVQKRLAAQWGYVPAGAQPAPSINEGVRKVTLSFRWESEAQHHIPTIEIEFDPVSPDSPNDAKGWQDRDRIASMLSPKAKP